MFQPCDRKWRLCEIIYEGFNCTSKILLESMCKEEFMEIDKNKALKFIEDLIWKTMK